MPFETPSLVQNLVKLSKTANTMLLTIKIHCEWSYCPSNNFTLEDRK